MRLSAGIASLPVFFYLFKNNNFPEIIKRQLSFWGKNTLVIYIVSIMMIKYGTMKIDNLTSFWMFLISVLSCIIICNACSFISITVSKFPLLDFIVFGRNKIKYAK